VPLTIINEYKKLLNLKNQIDSELSLLPKGSISRKVINGKTYYYLQNRESGRHVSHYLKSDEVEHIIKQLAVRKQLTARLPDIESRLAELEKAAKIIDSKLFRELQLLKLSSRMDDLLPDQKAASISFAQTMNAIEGVMISETTAKDIVDWQQGEKPFLRVFEAALQRYGFTRKAKHA